MWQSQGWAEVASGGTASTADTVMMLSETVLPENVMPKPADSVLAQPSPCAAGIRPPTKAASQGPQIPFSLNHSVGYGSKDSGAGLVQRSALAPVDGSPAAGGLTTAQPTASNALPSIFFGAAACPQRKRSAEPGVAVFDDFREERSRSRGMHEQNSLPTSVADSTPSVASTGSGAPATLGGQEVDVDMADDDEGEQENVAPFGLPAPPTNPGAFTGASGVAGLGISGAWERPVMRDLVLEVPAEIQEHEDSDIEYSDGEDMPSENLAFQLEERIEQNTGNCYDFEIYCDP